MVRPLIIFRTFLNSFNFFSIFSFLFIPFFSSNICAEITLDGSLGPPKNLSGPDFVIDAADGKLIGNSNLFHSFGHFNIDAGESATFIGPNNINSIIGRVTGGEKSSINGALYSKIPGADLYLINPGGFIFGPNASLDVQGSFHVSTADYLRLNGEGNGVFYADLGMDSILTVESPSAFGFLSDQPAAITVDQSALQVPEGKDLSIVGGDINIGGLETTSTDFLLAPSGRINLASVSSSGEALLNSPEMPPNLDVDTFNQLGVINLSEAFIDAGGNGGGTVIIRGGQFIMDNSYLYASTKGPVESNSSGLGIDIQAAGDVTLGNFSFMGTNVLSGVTENSGGIRIKANHLKVNNSQIQSTVFSGTTTGRSGDIKISTDSLLLENGGGIFVGTGGIGESGNIYLNTGDLVVKDGGYVFSSAFAGTGKGGDIEVNAGHILLYNENQPTGVTGLLTQTFWPGTGQAGDLSVNANSLEMYPGTEISSATFFIGQAGNLQVAIEGDVYIQGTKDKFPNGDPINTGIFNNTFWTANGGNLNISAKSLEMTTAAGIQVVTFSVGNAGIAYLDVGDLSIKDGSYISSNGFYGTGGDAGGVIIKADNILISGPQSSDDPFGLDATGISTTSGVLGGRGGNIDITTNTLSLRNRSVITSISRGPGDGGQIKIEAESMEVLNGSQVTASAAGLGNGGVIDIEAGSIRVAGVHPDPYFEATNNSQTLAISGIASQALQNGGSGGQIIIDANFLKLEDSGRLTTETYGAGNAGGVEIFADEIFISGANPVFENFLSNFGENSQYAGAGIFANTDGFLVGDQATGNGGNIDIHTRILEMSDQGQVTGTTNTPGDGGGLNLSASNIKLSEKAIISFASFNQGDAGSITITADQMDIIGSSSISSDHVGDRFTGLATTTSDSGNGGPINVDLTGNLTLTSGGVIKADTQGLGSGGAIAIGADSLVLSDSGNINSSSTGPGDAGSISINANEMGITGTGPSQPALDDGIFTGLATTTTSTGHGGIIDVSLSGDLILADGGVVKANTQGNGNGGTINLTAHNIRITDNGSVNNSSTGTGDAGDILLTVTDSLNMRHSSITTEASEESDGGNIDLSVRDILYLYYSEITSSVGGGTQTTGGNISIDPQFVVLNESRIVANAYAGTGGNIKIVADTFLSSPQSLVDASSQLGVSGTVDIQAPIKNISGLVPPISTEFLSASALLKERCIARLREGGKYSSFVIGGRDGLPIEPGNLLPSITY